MQQQIRNIIFDLGGVILDIDIKKTQEAFKKIGFKNIEQLFGLGVAESFFKEHERGTITDDEFVEKIRKSSDHAADDNAIIDAWNAMLLEFPKERIEFLQQLKKKYRLFLFSNTNGIHVEAFKKLYHTSFQNGSLDDLFEKAYYSHIAGYRKPDHQSFRNILEDSNLKPEETLFIDDALVNVEAAREVGMKAIHLQPGKTIIDVIV
jgi:putative hydrolase of the HAD superfamily